MFCCFLKHLLLSAYCWQTHRPWPAHHGRHQMSQSITGYIELRKGWERVKSSRSYGQSWTSPGGLFAFYRSWLCPLYSVDHCSCRFAFMHSGISTALYLAQLAYKCTLFLWRYRCMRLITHDCYMCVYPGIVHSPWYSHGAWIKMYWLQMHHGIFPGIVHSL